ncbi:MAG: hypothetical protein L6R19_24290, partial [Alphaproteobacteria bacterium]|nr:hypothetical protein [Alphaproteobacteria bacterium]
TFAELARLKRDRLVAAALPVPPRGHSAAEPAPPLQPQASAAGSRPLAGGKRPGVAAAAAAGSLPPAPAGLAWRAPAPDELQRALSGHTLAAMAVVAPRDRRARVWIHFRPDGAATFRNENGARDDGTWVVDQAGALCTTWRGLRQGKRTCFRVWLAGDMLHWEGGERLNRTTGRLIKGEVN